MFVNKRAMNIYKQRKLVRGQYQFLNRYYGVIDFSTENDGKDGK